MDKNNENVSSHHLDIASGQFCFSSEKHNPQIQVSVAHQISVRCISEGKSTFKLSLLVYHYCYFDSKEFLGINNNNNDEREPKTSNVHETTAQNNLLPVHPLQCLFS